MHANHDIFTNQSFSMVLYSHKRYEMNTLLWYEISTIWNCGLAIINFIFVLQSIYYSWSCCFCFRRLQLIVDYGLGCVLYEIDHAKYGNVSKCRRHNLHNYTPPHINVHSPRERSPTVWLYCCHSTFPTPLGHFCNPKDDRICGFLGQAN